MRISLINKIYLFVFLALLIVSVATVLTKYSNKKIITNNYWVNHTKNVLLQSEQILSTLKDVETGTRGFAITGDTIFLQLYAKMQGGVEQNISSLKDLTTDNLAQQQLISNLTPAAEKKLAMCKTIIEKRKQDGIVSAAIIGDVETGKKLMDQVRVCIQQIQDNENRLLVTRENTTKESETKMDNIFTLFFCILFFLLLILMFSFGFNIRIGNKLNGKLLQVTTKTNFFDDKVASIMNSIADPFFAIDKEGRFTFINSAAKSKLRLDAYGLIGANSLQTNGPVKNKELLIKMQQALEKREPVEFEMFDYFFERWQDVSILPIDDGLTVHVKDASEKKKNEKEILKMHQFLKETNEVANVGGWDLDVATANVYWSPITRQIHETEPDFTPNLNKAINFYKEGSSRDAITKAVTNAMENCESWDLELQIITAKGNEKWVRAKGSTEMKDGNCIRVYGSFQDITEKIMTQAAIAEKHHLLDMLINNIPVNVFIKDINSKKILINRKEMEYMDAQSEEEILGKTDFELYPYESACISVEEDKLVMNTGVPIMNKETFNTRKDGSYKWFLTSKIPLRNAENKISGILGISYDITERKLAEQRLMIIEQRFKAMFDSSTNGIALLDISDGSFIDVNNTMASMLGYTKEELMQLHLKNISYPDDINPDDDNEPRGMIAEKIKPPYIKKRYMHKDGHAIFTELTTSIAIDDTENPQYVLFQVKNIGSDKLN